MSDITQRTYILHNRFQTITENSNEEFICISKGATQIHLGKQCTLTKLQKILIH